MTSDKNAIKNIILEDVAVGTVFYPSEIAGRYGLDLETVMESIAELQKEVGLLRNMRQEKQRFKYNTIDTIGMKTYFDNGIIHIHTSDDGKDLRLEYDAGYFSLEKSDVSKMLAGLQAYMEETA